MVQPDQERGWRARPMPDSRCGEPPLGAVVKTSAGPDGTLLAWGFTVSLNSHQFPRESKGLFPDEGVGDAAAVVGGRGASVPG